MFNILVEKRGFTLIELLTVVAIMAIIGAVVAPNLFRAIDKGKVTAAVADFRSIKNAALAYYADTGKRPPENPEGDDPGLITSPENVSGWNGPYLESWPGENPWGGKYSFVHRNSQGGEALYLCLDGIPESAASMLKEQLKREGTSVEIENDKVYIFLLK